MTKLTSRRISLIVSLLILLIVLVWGGIAANQRLTRLQRQIDVEWSAIDNEYQRLADYGSRLAQTASAIPDFDPSAITGIGQAQTVARQIKLDPKRTPIDAGKLEKFDQAQAMLSKALFHVVAWRFRHPEIKLTSDFRNATAQLMDLQTNISIVRNRFNEATLNYNDAVHRFPDSIYAAAFGFNALPTFPLEGSNSASVSSR